MGYTWLHNNKVIFSYVNSNERSYLVCANNSQSFSSINFVENAETGKRVFPSLEQKSAFPNDPDGLVRMLISLVAEE